MWWVILLKGLCVFTLVTCGLAYLNNLIVDIGSAIASTRTMSPTPADDADRSVQFAAYRINLGLIMGIAGGILICLP